MNEVKTGSIDMKFSAALLNLGKVGFRTFGLMHSITLLSTLNWTFSGHSQVNMTLKQYLAILIDGEKM